MKILKKIYGFLTEDRMKTARTIVEFVLMVLSVIGQVVSHMINTQNLLFEYSWAPTLSRVVLVTAIVCAAIAVLMILVSIVSDVRSMRNGDVTNDWKISITSYFSSMFIVIGLCTMIFNMHNGYIGYAYSMLQDVASAFDLFVYNAAGIMLILIAISIVPWVYYLMHVRDDIKVVSDEEYEKLTEQN